MEGKVFTFSVKTEEDRKFLMRLKRASKRTLPNFSRAVIEALKEAYPQYLEEEVFDVPANKEPN